MTVSDEALSNLLHENRRFPPSPEFTEQANVTAECLRRGAVGPVAFWDKQGERLQWATH